MIVWLAVFGLFAAGLAIGRPWSMAIGGIAVASFAMPVATNFHGFADVMPRRSGLGPFWHEQSPAMIRLTFGLFALMGILVFGVSVFRLLS